MTGGVLQVAPEQRDDWSRVAQLMGMYRDTPMALADAQLMALAADLGEAPIFTLDSDFVIYRLPKGPHPCCSLSDNPALTTRTVAEGLCEIVMASD